MDIKVGNGGKPNAKRQARGHKCYWVSTRNSKVAKLSGKGEVLWFHTLAEAQAKADELNAAQHTGGVVTRAAAGTLQATVDLFIRATEDRVAERTMGEKCKKNYVKAATDWLDWLGANTKTCDIVPNDIYAALNATTLSHKTKKEKLATLQDLLDIARNHKWTSNDNVAKAVTLLQPHHVTEEEAIEEDIDAFDMEKMRELIKQAHARDMVNHKNGAWSEGLALSFALQTGLRFGEQAALRWSAVDFDKRTVKVLTALRDAPGGGKEIGQTKTKKGKRVVQLSKALVAELRAWKMRSPYSSDKDFVFPTRAGHPQRCSNNWRKRVLHPLCDAVGIDRLKWHYCRHFYASLLLANYGNDWNKIADRMGHAKADFTRSQYGHWIETDEDDDTDEIGDALWN